MTRSENRKIAKASTETSVGEANDGRLGDFIANHDTALPIDAAIRPSLRAPPNRSRMLESFIDS